MSGVSNRHITLVAVFGTINVIGLVWIHHDLTTGAQATTRVLSAEFLPDNDCPDRFQLTFDRDMIGGESIGQTDNASLFALSPAWPGRWIWRASNKLDYVLEKPLPAGRVLRIAAAKDFEKRTGRTLEGIGEFELATSALRLQSCLIEAYDEHDVTCRIIFNQPVDPADLLRHANVSNARGPQELGELLCITKSPQAELVIRFPRPSSNFFKLAIDAELTGHEGELGLGVPAVIEQEVPVRFALLHSRVGAPSLDGGGSVSLRFSHRLDAQQEIPEIQIAPPVAALRIYHYGQEMVLSGKFQARQTYTLEIPATLLAENGTTLKEDLSVTIEIPAYQPKVQFAHSKGILSPVGALTLDMKAVNIEALELSAWRMHANNLVPYLHGGQVDETSRSVLEMNVEVAVADDKPTELAVDIGKLLSSPMGVYRIEARATDRYWTQDRAIVTITDLAITAKRQRDGYMVWVTSLRTAQPVSGVTVAGLTYNNQTVATAQTDAEGIATLRFSDNHPDGNMWVITATKNGDLSYLLPGDNQWVLDEANQGGRPYANHYETMLYTDRGLYRPGEEIHLTGVIRDTTGATPSAFPLSIRIWRPDGRQVADLLVNRRENDQGMFHTSYTTAEHAQTGPYRINVTLPGDDEPLGSTTALVEAFVPVRMEVKATPSAERFDANNPPSMHISGRYLWDQPAADLPVKIEGTLWATRFNPKTYPQFEFGLDSRQGPISLPATEGRLDEQGQSQTAVNLPETLKPALYRMTLSATVTEPGGRSVSGTVSATLDLVDTHIGLRSRDGQVVGVDEAFLVDWVRLNGLEEPAPAGPMNLQVFHVEYDTVLKWVDERRVWQSIERTEQIGQDQPIAAHGTEGTLEITVPDSGTYRLVITDTKTGSSTEWQFYASRYKSDSPSIPMDQPEHLEIIADKETYLPGQKARILVRSPISGTLLLTCETDVVATHIIETLEGKAFELEVPLSEDLRGSAFITGTVVRAVDPNEESWLPHRAMGTSRVKLDHSGQRLAVRITAPASASPGQTLSVMVQTGQPLDPNRPAVVHLWAVDTGILLAGAYQSPNPYDVFLGPRQAGVSTADTFFWLLPDYKRPAGIARIGAGEFDLDSLRRNPVPTRSRQPGVIWRQAAPVDAAGQIIAEVSMPELTGEMRLMAVAVDDDRYGHAEQALTLTSPLLVEASWPRFAAPGDEFAVPVKLFNAADRDLTVKLEAAVSGPIEIVSGQDAKMIEVGPGRPTTTVLQVRAAESGPVEVDITATEITSQGTGLVAHSRMNFAVRPATGLHSEVELTTIQAGERATIEPPETLTPGTVRMAVSVSARPAVQLKPAVEDLIRYPYGCLEQTSSQLLSLLYASSILDAGRTEEIEGMVKAGIARLWAMQTPSGGFSYWPGDSTPCLWGTAYAASCLAQAKNAGYDLDPQFIDELTKFLAAKLKESEFDAPDIGTKALIARVLTTFDQPPHGWMARLAEQKERLDIAARAHLAAAFAATGDNAMAQSLLPERPPQIAIPTSTTGRLTSQIRQDAVWLSVLLEMDPNHPMVGPLASRLDQARKAGQWGSTLNNAAAIAALSRYQAMSEPHQPQFTGSIQAGPETPIHFDSGVPVSLKLDRVTEPLMINSTGQGTVYITTVSEGLAKADMVKPYSYGLTATRRWTDASGNPLDVNSLSVGDLIHVEITIHTNGPTVHNIAVVDALPGGTEVENPRLATSTQLTEPAGDQPDRVEFLDDRIVLFCSAGAEKQVFRYALRAITAGTFDHPPVQASCMYDPAFACMGPGGHVTIGSR